MQEGNMLLWYKDKDIMILFEKSSSVQELVEIANNHPADQFQITSTEHTRVLNGTRVWGEVLWRMEGSRRALIPQKY